MRFWKTVRGGDAAGHRGARQDDILRWCREVVTQVNALEPGVRSRSDEELRASTGAFRHRLDHGEPLDGLLPEAFAVVREAAARALGQRHFDVQIMGGAVLYAGKVAEMQTGEGKTLAATLPAYLNALPGTGVHVMTANDFLASRDVEWMGPVYRFLELDIGLLAPEPDAAARRLVYAADVTYGSYAEFGYDYLRDNLAWNPEDQVQRGQRFAIVDEADLVMIDEIRTPLQISGPLDEPESRHAEFAEVAAALERDKHYSFDAPRRSVSLTEDGAQLAGDRFGTEGLTGEAATRIVRQVENALRAKEFFLRDRDYMLDDGAVVIIDQTSGRPQHGRRYGEGVHEAIEAKEGLTVRPETQILAVITVWEYLRQYERPAAMTGTAMAEAEVFRRVYHMDVVPVPTNKPVIRVDHMDGFYTARQAKLAAVADETAARHATGQPVLVGCASISEADDIARLLRDHGVGHQVLTARNHLSEAAIIAEAGQIGAVTVIARMAGRGVDIILGGSTGADRDTVADLGGLCVLGTERYETRRLEMHLRGRVGRQGDPGESKFYTSMEDDLIKKAVGEKAGSFLAQHSKDGDSTGLVSRSLDKRQASATAGLATSLDQLLDYERVQADQRQLVYAERRAAAAGEDLGDQVQDMIDDVIRDASAAGAHLKPDQLCRKLQSLYPVRVSPQTLIHLSAREIADRFAADAQQAYQRRQEELGTADLRDLERRATLSVTDRCWRGHLKAMTDLLHGIGTRFPDHTAALPAYQREAADRFAEMQRDRKQRIVATVFYVKIESPTAASQQNSSA